MRNRRFGRLIAATLLCSLAAEQAWAVQFGGLFGGRSSQNEESENNCADAESSAGRSILRGVLGGAASQLGIPTFVPSAAFADVLATEIACRLNEEEQEQAADATLEATRSGEVGASSSWTSTSREGVSGSSTVAGRTQLADGSDCMQINDVIIVEGEETTVTKQMCRAPGSARYTMAA